jgi:hypothetical protein
LGYTHSWTPKDDGVISPETWEKICDDVQKLVAASPAPVLWESDSNLPPELSADLIRFNGKLGDGYETFYFERSVPRLSFCKTAQKPYDHVVVGALACIAEHAPDKVQISSDGGEDDWEEGLAWASKTLGLPLKYPVFEDEDA